MRELDGAPEPAALPGPEVRQLPSNAGKLDRISAQTRGLVDDVTSWVDLKMQLVKAEVTETVEDRLNKAVVGAIVAVVALITVIFLLITIALALGAWLGHPAWGFLIVTILLAIVTAGVARARPHLIKMGHRRSHQAHSRSNPE